MSVYNRGADFERKLLAMFWERGWAAVRAAGSGTRPEPVPDIIAAKDGRLIIVECKSTKADRLSLKPAIEQLARFYEISGGSAYMALRFFRKKPRFYELSGLLDADNFTIRQADDYMEIEQVCELG